MSILVRNKYKPETHLISNEDVDSLASLGVGDSDGLTAVASTCVSLGLESTDDIVVTVDFAASTLDTILSEESSTRRAINDLLKTTEL